MKKQKKEKIFIWGAGGQGRVVLDILRTAKNFEIQGFIDSDKKIKNKDIDGVKILGDKSYLDTLWKKGVKAGIVAIGDNEKRCQIADYLKGRKFKLINAIHPQSAVATNVSIGNNVTINAGAIVGTYAVIEDNVIINTGAIIEHENIIRNGAHIASGVQLAGCVEVGEKTLVGIGATVIQYIKIGKNSVVGAGAVVLNDIKDNVVAVGIPAKIIKERFNFQEEKEYQG
jgi:sugar O-acyltransferase (sialic acid O-acetyltransferase NeuD family)